MSTKSHKFLCSTSVQEARIVITFIHGQWLVHESQEKTGISVTRPKQLLKANKSDYHVYTAVLKRYAFTALGFYLPLLCRIGFFSLLYSVTMQPHYCNVSSNHQQ